MQETDKLMPRAKPVVLMGLSDTQKVIFSWIFLHNTSLLIEMTLSEMMYFHSKTLYLSLIPYSYPLLHLLVLKKCPQISVLLLIPIHLFNHLVITYSLLYQKVGIVLCLMLLSSVLL